MVGDRLKKAAAGSNDRIVEIKDFKDAVYELNLTDLLVIMVSFLFCFHGELAVWILTFLDLKKFNIVVESY